MAERFSPLTMMWTWSCESSVMAWSPFAGCGRAGRGARGGAILYPIRPVSTFHPRPAEHACPRPLAPATLPLRMKILDIGCGKHNTPGAVGMDSNPRSDADVLHDLDVVPYPFPDDEFDLVVGNQVIEHVTDVLAV